MHGLTEGRSVRPAVRPGEGNSPTIKPYREYVPLCIRDVLASPKCPRKWGNGSKRICEETDLLFWFFLKLGRRADHDEFFPTIRIILARTTSSRQLFEKKNIRNGIHCNSSDWLFHLKIMSSLVWKKSAIFCRRQRHQCRDPQANVQPSGMCYKKGSATSTIWTEHFALHPHGKPVSRAYPMAAVF